MQVGVIIPAFNVAAWVGNAVQSVLNQTHSDWSLVVVNDGSTDATGDVLRWFTDRRITVVDQTNLGVSAARNRGIKEISCDAILFLDADDWLAPSALDALSRTLESSASAVAATAGYAKVAGDGSIHSVATGRNGSLLRQLLVRNLFINGGHLLIRREAIQTVGQFNTGLRFGEDWEYWTRLALLGDFVSTTTSEPLLFVRERPGSATMTMAADSGRFAPTMDAIYGNPAIIHRIGGARLADLRRRAEAENAWVIGRELIRHMRPQEGRTWLTRSLRAAPGIKRLGLWGLSWLQVGPFRPYVISEW
jgi:glycosyltransferase involved in cell wall biosynthesis